MRQGGSPMPAIGLRINPYECRCEGGENTRRNVSVRVVWKRPERFPPRVIAARFGGRGMASRIFDVRTGTVDGARSRAKHGAREGRKKGQLTLVSARRGGSYLVRD